MDDSLEQAEGDVPRPEIVAAMLALDLLVGAEANRTPLWAAWWLVQGHDGTALRRLAGLSGEDPFDVRDAAQAALDEMGIRWPSNQEACRTMFDEWAVTCLAGNLGERSLVGLVEQLYVASGYASWVQDEPLGETYGMDDEWQGGWGRTESDLLEGVRSLCNRQLAH